MIYEVSEKKGDTWRVDLREIEEGVYEVKLGDRTVRVDAVRSSSTIYSVIEDGRQYEAMVDPRGAHDFDIFLAGRLFHFTVVDERSKLLAASAKAGATGPQVVEAEMPGKVVKVAAAAGDAVQEGQGIVVVEAMKMENEIASPIDGVLREVPVSEGQTVETGAVLFVVEPPPAENAPAD